MRDSVQKACSWRLDLGCTRTAKQAQLRSQRFRRNDVLAAEAQRVWRANLRGDGVRKVCRQLRSEGFIFAA